MPDDMMDDGMDAMYPSEESSTSTEEKPKSIDEEEKKASAKTTIIDKSVLNGKGEVGHVCKMKVVADYGDEVEMEYVPESETKSTEMSSDEEIDALNEG